MGLPHSYVGTAPLLDKGGATLYILSDSGTSPATTQSKKQTLLFIIRGKDLMHNSTNSTTLHNFASGKVAFTIYILNSGAKVLIKFYFHCTFTVMTFTPVYWYLILQFL